MNGSSPRRQPGVWQFLPGSSVRPFRRMALHALESLRACVTSGETKIMAIPISYNIRNMILRKRLTLMTALGIALTVTTTVFLMMLLAGMKKAFVSSGDPLNVLVMRKGSTSELAGGFTKDKLPVLKELPGIAKDSHGEPFVSGEWVVIVVLPRKDGTGEVNVTLRGMGPDGFELRPRA